MSPRSIAPLALSLLLATGCAGAGAPASAPALEPSPEASTLPADAALFGLYHLELDGAALTAELATRETQAFGDSYLVNATGYLAGVPCRDCLKPVRVARDALGNIQLTMRARHPFPPGDPAQPISGSNRLDLHVFDAQLQVAGDLDNVSVIGFEGIQHASRRMLLNADGFSGVYDDVARTLNPGLQATLLPYVIVNPDPTPGNFDPASAGGFTDLQAPTGHNVFPMGADVEATLTLGLTGSESAAFDILFVASYGISSPTRADRLTPRYALPEYNAKLVWKSEIDLPPADNDLRAGDTGSMARVIVRGWDWQHGASIDPTLASLDAIRASSDLQTARVHAPGIMSAPLDLGAPVSGSGPYDDPLVYEGFVINDLGAPGGDYVVVAELLDSRSTGLNSGEQTDALSNQDGTTLEPITVDSFVTYQVAPVTVASSDTLLSIAITPGTRQILGRTAGSNTIAFTAIGTYQVAGPVDITATAAWSSTAADCAAFGGDNILDAVGMGRTFVRASLDGVDSPQTEVIVRAAELVNLREAGIAYELGDADQNTGTFYLATESPSGVRIYNDNGTYSGTSWFFGIPGGTTRTLSVDEVNSRVVVVSGDLNATSFNVVVKDYSGVTQHQYIGAGVPFGNIPGIDVLDNGQYWVTYDDTGPFANSPFDMTQINRMTGASLGGFDVPGFTALTRGTDNFGNLVYVADIIGSFPPTNQGLHIVNPATQTKLVSFSSKPAQTGQMTSVVVDRDGFVHCGWDGTFGSPNTPPIVQVYEYIQPTTLTLLYTYSPTTANLAANLRGLSVSRPTNKIVMTHNDMQFNLTWFD